jgi:hypothetical protein
MLRVGFPHEAGKEAGRGISPPPGCGFYPRTALGARVAPQQSPVLRHGTTSLTLKLTSSQHI